MNLNPIWFLKLYIADKKCLSDLTDYAYENKIVGTKFKAHKSEQVGIFDKLYKYYIRNTNDKRNELYYSTDDYRFFLDMLSAGAAIASDSGYLCSHLVLFDDVRYRILLEDINLNMHLLLSLNTLICSTELNEKHIEELISISEKPYHKFYEKNKASKNYSDINYHRAKCLYRLGLSIEIHRIANGNYRRLYQLLN